MKIKICKRLDKVACLIVLYFTLFVGFGMYNFSWNPSILYFCDFIVAILFVVQFKKIIRLLKDKLIVGFLIPIVLLVIFGALSAIAYDGGNLLRWLWSIRNWGRLFFYFLIVVATMKSDDCSQISCITYKIYHINVFVVLIQFLFFGGLYTQDSLNGLFGRETSSVNLTMTLIVLALTISQYYTKKIPRNKFIFVMFEILIVSAIAELRVVPIIVVLAVVIAYIMSFKLNIKRILRFILSGALLLLCIIIGSEFLKILYPDTAMNYSISDIIDAATTKGGYGYSGGIDRLTFITVINKIVFNGRLFFLYGIGTGNAEYAIVESLCSPFYLRYGKTIGYLNFSSAMLYVETGIIGLGLYIISYLYVFKCFFSEMRRKIKIRKYNEISSYVIFGGLMAVINILYVIYNNLQRTDISYLLAFYLAIAVIGMRKEQQSVQ